MDEDLQVKTTVEQHARLGGYMFDVKTDSVLKASRQFTRARCYTAADR